MYSSRFSKLFSVVFLCLFVSTASADLPLQEAAKVLPGGFGSFRKAGQVLPPLRWLEHTQYKPEDFNVVSAANQSYVSPDGKKIVVDVIQTNSNSAAYALLTRVKAGNEFSKLEGVGTEAIIVKREPAVSFCKGTVYAFVFSPSSGGAGEEALVSFARSLADSIDAEASEIPSLVLHLPEWETAQARAHYAVTPAALRHAVENQPALEAVSFGGGTEAVTADYGARGRLVVVEYATPQVAFESDARIRQRITELAAAGQSAPSLYRREGNYSVFVFGAPDAAAAAQLAGRVKYEKDVRWLGDNPYAHERHNRAWLSMSTSVIVNTVKAAGLAILLCLGVGGLFGAIIFRRRRAQAALAESYSDAGGMMRLDLDDHAAKLLGHGEK